MYAVTNTADFGAPAQGTWSFTGNTIEDATNNTGTASGSVPVPVDEGVGDGLDLDGASGVTVQGNTITGNADWGLALFGTSYSTIGGTTKAQANTITKNAADGIYVGLDAYNPSTGTGIAYATSPSVYNTISGNTSSNNSQDGIFADGADMNGNQQDADNQFNANVLQTNLRYDAEDLSSGSGTAGTNNSWTGNICKPVTDSAPTGLCG